MRRARVSRTFRPAVATVAVVALVLVAASAAREQVVSATAVITGSGTSYRVTWNNTGDQAILCAGLLLTGVQPISASGPPGVLTRVGTFQGRGLVHMQGTPAVPAIPAGANVRNGLSLRPTGTAVVTFATNVPIRANAGGEIRYSATCLPNSDQFGQASGPPPADPPPPPPVKPKKCECDRVDAATRGVSIGQFTWSMTVDWTLTCKGDAGVGCKGEIRDFGWVGNEQILVTRPKPPRAKKGQPPNRVVVACKGRCAKKPSKGSTRISGSTKTRAFRTAIRAGQGYTFSFNSYCGDRKTGRYRVYVKFDAKGRLDRKASDLNGNGTIDNQEKKKKK